MYMTEEMKKRLIFIIEYTKQNDEIRETINNDPDTRALEALTDLETWIIKDNKRLQEQSKKTWERIKERRKDDPNYCRPKKEWR